MACSICGHEGHNRSTCAANPEIAGRRERAWADVMARNALDQERAALDESQKRARRRRDRILLWLTGCGIVVGAIVFATRSAPTRGPAIVEAQTSTPSAAPPKPLRDAGRPPVRWSDAGQVPRRPYDDAGLVDGSIPGAPPGWKPVPMPPAPDGGAPVQ